MVRPAERLDMRAASAADGSDNVGHAVLVDIPRRDPDAPGEIQAVRRKAEQFAPIGATESPHHRRRPGGAADDNILRSVDIYVRINDAHGPDAGGH